MRAVRLSIPLIILLAILTPAGALAAPGAHGEILWDKYGVGHVYAGSERGLFFGYGWAQAKSHGDVLARLYAEGRGRAAEIWGPSEAKSDRWMAINGVPERAKVWLVAQPPTFRADLEAFAAGINAYAAAHPDALSPQARQVLPVSALDVVAYALKLFQYVYLAPPEIADKLPAAAAEPFHAISEPAGSNGWAIGPSRSADGHAMLLMNPHLPWATGWSTYYEIQLTAPGLDLYGASQVGLPVLRFVFSEDLGFTQTVDAPNNVTLYRIKIGPGGYLFDGKVRAFQTVKRSIRVRQDDGSLKTETFEVRSTVHGPIVATAPDGAPVALRAAGLERPRALYQYWRMQTAHDFAGYQQALSMVQVPSFNVIYADRGGHIEYLMNGLVPKKQGRDLAYWAGLVPGDRSDTLWTSYLTYAELPKTIDPPVGAVQNSNDPPWDAGWPQVEDPKPYANQIASDAVSLRMARGVRMLSEHPKIDFDQLVALKWSDHSELADRVLPELDAAVATYGTDLAKQAISVLDKWDRETRADSRGALLFLNWSDRKGAVNGYSGAGFARPYALTDPLGTPSGLADPKAAAAALDAAAKDMLATTGALDTPWGQVMRIQRGAVDLPASGAGGRLGVFDVVDYGAVHNGQRAALFGDSFIAIVAFGAQPRAKVLVTYGNASQDHSPHISDQAPLLAAHTLRDAWRTRAEALAHLESRDA